MTKEETDKLKKILMTRIEGVDNVKDRTSIEALGAISKAVSAISSLPRIFGEGDVKGLKRTPTW